MITIIRMTRALPDTPIANWHYPRESIAGRYQHVWSLDQREAWLRGRGERLRIFS